ncbi:MAG: DsrE family protein [Nitrospirae bacterium]|nr:DsrE family protein [Nitrospirota bacterium]
MRPVSDERRKLGFLLSTGPEHPNLDTVTRLSDTALRKGHDVYLYLIDEGTRCLDTPQVAQLPKRGAKLFVCAFGAQKMGVPIDSRATFCGLVVLSDIVSGCDRFLAFN